MAQLRGQFLSKDIRAGTSNSGIESITQVGGTIYFSASDGITGSELWKSDGTASGTVQVKEF